MEFQTEILPLDQSRKLLAAIQKPSKQGRWMTLCEESQGVMEEKEFSDVKLDELKGIILPRYCSDIDIIGQRVVDKNSLPERLLLSGDDWTMSANGQTKFVCLSYISRLFRIPISVRFTHDNTRGYINDRGRDFVSILTLGGGTHAFYSDSLPGFDPEMEEIKGVEVTSILDDYQKKYGFPSGSEKEFIDIKIHPESIEYTLEPELSSWIKYEKIMRLMCSDDAEGDVVITAKESLGGDSTIFNGPQNIRQECQKLMDFALASEFQVFSVDYGTLKPETWPAREKRRKKWKKPILQELGILDLKGVGEADVKVIIEKEGYTFALDFHEEEAFGFADTPLFKKAEWHSGDE